MLKLISSKWHLALKVIPFIMVVVGAKYIAHIMHLELLELNSLFTALISANIFLVGFLIAGVLTDHKESEKIPGEIASSIETIIDECAIIAKNKKAPIAKKCIKDMNKLLDSILNWLHNKEDINSIYAKLTGLNTYFLAFEPLTQANFIVRLKQEQNNIRKYITRINTIKVTNFIKSGYAIVEIITIAICIGLVFIKIDPFFESAFFIGFVTFVLIYMIMLIHDLDDPFDYSKEAITDEISLRPLTDLKTRLEK